jgi:6-pyruvoyl tetrahydropterin synthase/QueD family protein
MLYLSRRTDFSAMHSYIVPDWSDEKNASVFGPCNNSNGHGHDYKLEVMVKGRLNEKSGIVINTTDIKNIVEDFVGKELDGKFLNREKAIEKSVLNSVLEFTEGTPQKDDITMVLLKVHKEESNISCLNSPILKTGG